MASNRTVSKAKANKQDEFYTQLSDISNELRHYRSQLRGKVIFCNCDDPYESNFFRYFALNFNTLGIKKIIATSYAKSAIAGRYLPLLDIEGLKPEGKEPYAIEINEVPDHNGDGATDLTDVEYLLKHDANTARPLKGDSEWSAGDFRSFECVEYLSQADVVVTNPPFSLFREYVSLLANHKKEFLVIGNQNAIDYRVVFDLIRQDKLWLGVDNGGTKWFRVPDDYEIATTSRKKVEDGVKYFSMGSIMWFTNMDNPKRHETIPLYKSYSSEEYPTYDNYDAIEVSRVAEIPADYDGVMGVPITFLDKYNPSQFEIVGMCENRDLFGLKTRVYTTQECQKTYQSLFGKKGTYDLNAAGVVNGRKVYKRLLIKRKNTYGNLT
ncbi:adenine-specific methyltransferase EcoRI family protein [Aureimonas psammosilenae]|uniref:adenine-specific methyltransferase EcoRI family protein n=1 Tax=Aureimonas psammosilenae TaxID=2495496 RepID=UPI0012606907|nr:adenine-specific methyltransferase EcoRI family protein [Aureimonas psammosilenae]